MEDIWTLYETIWQKEEETDDEQQNRPVYRVPARTRPEQVQPEASKKEESKPSKEEGSVNDSVNHPKHYNSHPSGVEVIDITEHMNFCLGNAIKYILRADLKHDTPIEDLKKAVWYVNREIERISNGAAG